MTTLLKTLAENIFGSSLTKNKKKYLKAKISVSHDAARLSASFMATRWTYVSDEFAAAYSWHLLAIELCWVTRYAPTILH